MNSINKKISAIIACYRDAEAIPLMAERLIRTFEGIDVDYEIIFVNDGSPDDTQQVLERLTSRTTKIKAITHSRNFGSQNAFTSGMKMATGDCCVLLDGDLQDPPEMIADFFYKWREGYDVVYGIREKREMPLGWELAYKAFYRLFHKLAYIQIPVDVGDFSLIDRKIIDILNILPERDRLIRGLRAWTGFRQIGIAYTRPKRMFGNSTNSLISNIRWAKRAIFSFSYAPLEFISISAFITSMTCFLLIVFQVVDRIFRPNLPRGISTVIVVCAAVASIQLISLAVIAEYIGRIFEEVKQRPQFIVSKTLNFDVEKNQHTDKALGLTG